MVCIAEEIVVADSVGDVRGCLRSALTVMSSSLRSEGNFGSVKFFVP